MAKKSVKSIKSADATVAVSTTATGTETVTVLFRSRCGQVFTLRDGRSVTLEGNAVYLAGADGRPLPAGGYSVNIVDKALWAQVKAEFGKAYAPWFESGKIKEAKNERDGINAAQDNAGDDAGLNPFNPKSEGVTVEAKTEEG